MNTIRNLRIEQRLPGVATVILDMPDRPVNVLDEQMLRDLAQVLTQIESDPKLRLVVFRSAKESGFLAGADVRQLQGLVSPEQAETVLRIGQETFSRLSALSVPTLAVIHGPCLGGGLEFALACTWRAARDDSATRIGLPETQLGVIPGWGGTQRLPRLVGLSSALRMILEGQRLSAARAQSLGLVDMTAPPERFNDAVNAFVTERLAGKRVRRRERRGMARWLDESRIGRWFVFRTARRHIGRRALQYPALPAAIRAIETGLKQGMDRGHSTEREEFSRVLFTPACRHLLDLFFQRERARKASTWTGGSHASPQGVNAVAVLGAGVMGAGIAQLAALRGYEVVLRDIRQDLVDQGMQRIEALTREAVRAGACTEREGAEALQRIAGTVEMGALAHVDVAIEAVVERLDIKRQVFGELDQLLPPSSMIVTNTSALPVSDLASATTRVDRTGGLHFFNPVHRMALVEVVRGRETSDETVAALVKLVNDLGKAPIVVSESPGFLVNRILFPYLDEGVRMVQEGIPAEKIDAEARRFGMPMGPLELLDQVGIDVAADVARTLLPLAAEDSPTPQVLTQMVSDGRLGRKSNRGFYAYRNGRAHGAAGRIAHTATEAKLPPAAALGGETLGGIAQRLILPMIDTAARCLSEHVVAEAWMVDLGMVLGTGFAPFRGGPLKVADDWGLRDLVATMAALETSVGPRFRACELLQEMQRDGRTFYPLGLDIPTARTEVLPVEHAAN